MSDHLEDSFLCPYCSTTGFSSGAVTTLIGTFCTQFCADEAQDSYDNWTNAEIAKGQA